MSKSSSSATSSRGSAGGRMRLGWRGGRKGGKSGLDRARANRSRKQGSAKAKRTRATSGPNSSVSSRTCDLQRSLESRLRQRMDVNGSPEYVLTWKYWSMQSGLRISALRASQRRISGRDCGGSQSARLLSERSMGEGSDRLMTGWPTPDSSVMQDGEGLDTWLKRRGELKLKHGNGNGCGTPLTMAAQMAGWGTPSSTERSGQGEKNISLMQQVRRFVTGWPSPNAIGDTTGGGSFQVGSQEQSAVEAPIGSELCVETARHGYANGNGRFWHDSVLIPCCDGRSRRVGTGIQPLATGISARMGKLRGAGNAIVPQVAAEFIMSYMDVAGIASGKAR